MNVLWLASWYPNRTDPFNGDFIERHARAVAPFINSLTVITAVKDDNLPFNAVEVVEQTRDNIKTYIVYYGRSRWGGIVEKLISFKKYTVLQQDIIDRIFIQANKPDIVHVHVAMKAGVVAKKIKQQYGIPYVVTEHWTAYDKQARPNIFEMGPYFLKLTKSVIKNASCLLTVSNELGKTINKNLIKVGYTVVPNVVDTGLFYYENDKENEVIKLVHISNMGYQKNVEAIIKALSIWKQSGGQFLLKIFGPVKADLQSLVKQNNLIDWVIFEGEVPQTALSREIKTADALILYSRYETFGCVIIEANACGVPVIVSDLPVFHELVREKENGIFIEPCNPAALAKGLEHFSQIRNNFDHLQISKEAMDKYGFHSVGQQITGIYTGILNR